MSHMDEQQNNDRRFTPDEAGELIRRATEISQQQDDGLTYEQVLEVAGEVGVSERAVAEALEQARREETARAAADEMPQAWRTVADRCLEILCLKPHERQRESAPRSG